VRRFNYEQRKAAGVKQPVFDLLDTIPDISPAVRHRKMYYVVNASASQMLETFDSEGKPVWCEHDLMRYQPHIISCVYRAQTIATECQGVARSCIKDDKARRYLPIAMPPMRDRNGKE
jgi:hypothetical protein